MELIKVGEKTYYIKNPTNIGMYKVNDTDVYLIDTGNDKDAGKKVLKLIDEQGWKVVGVINTHSHADHIGGNKIIQERTNCKIFLHGVETSFAKYTILEPTVLYGGCPLKDLKDNKFLRAKESDVEEVEGNLPEGLEIINLPGHYFDMIGVKTSDNVYFLGDSLISEETIKKYHVFFLYDVQKYLDTLDILANLNASTYIPSHTDAKKDIHELIKMNQDKIEEICRVILDICEEKHTFEEILQKIFERYELKMNVNQYVLVGCTIKSYLSYLNHIQKLDYTFKDNKMLWKINQEEE